MFYTFMPYKKIISCKKYYDEKKHLLYMPVSSGVTPYINYMSGYAHHISESLDYALYLLYTDDKNISRAKDIITEAIKYQCSDKNNVFFGCWSYFSDDGISDIIALDITLNCRIAITLLHIYTDYGAFFSKELTQTINEKILNSIFTILSKYDLQNSFTTSLCMYLSITYGELSSHIEFVKYGENLLQILYNSVMYHNSFYEYNDMQHMVDQTIFLHQLSNNIGSDYYKHMLDTLLNKTWEVFATHFHFETMQMSGPFSITLSDYTQPDVYNFLYYALNKTLDLPHYDASIAHSYSCPEKYLPYFSGKTLTGFSRSVVFMGIASPYFRHSIVQSNYMQKKYTLGSFSRELFWELKRPFIGFFIGKNKPYCYKIDVLHDFHSYASAALHSIQYYGNVLGHITFLTNSGDKHINFDSPNPSVSAEDLRIRFSISGEIEDLNISYKKNKLTVSYDGIKLYYSMPIYDFDGYEVKFQFSSDESSMYFDTVIYSGEATTIDFTELTKAIFQFTFLITSSGQNPPEIKNQYTDNSLTTESVINDLHFKLKTPASPGISSDCLLYDEQSINGTSLESYVTQLTEQVQDITFLEKKNYERGSFFPFLGSDEETAKILKLIDNIHFASINSLSHEAEHIFKLINRASYPIELQKRFAIQIVVNLFESVKKINYKFSDVIDRKHYNIYQRITAAVSYQSIKDEILKLCVAIEKEAPIFSSTYKNKNITDRMLKIISENLLNPDLSLNYLADTLGYSVSHLSRIFFESTGMKYVEYIQKEKITYAINQIKSKKCTIKEAAEQLGYSNANNFMRMFVKTTGMTVTQYLNRPEN